MKCGIGNWKMIPFPNSFRLQIWFQFQINCLNLPRNEHHNSLGIRINTALSRTRQTKHKQDQNAWNYRQSEIVIGAEVQYSAGPPFDPDRDVLRRSDDVLRLPRPAAPDGGQLLLQPTDERGRGGSSSTVDVDSPSSPQFGDACSHWWCRKVRGLPYMTF